MYSVLKWIGIASLCGAVLAPQAKAGIVNNVDVGLVNGTINAASLGGWTIQISGCTGTNTSCSSDTLTASVAGQTLSLVFSGTNNGSDFLYNSGGQSVDLSVTLVVTAPTGEGILIATNTLSASSSATGQLGLVSAGETLANAPPLLSSLAVSPLLQSEEFAPVVSPAGVTAAMDFGDGVSKVSIIPTATLTFNAPEPISTSLFAVGVAGLGFVRRKKRPTK